MYYLCIYFIIISLFFSVLGGSYLEVGDERCTHMVVEENSVKELPFSPSKKLFAVKQEVGPKFFGKSGEYFSTATKDKQSDTS